MLFQPPPPHLRPLPPPPPRPPVAADTRSLTVMGAVHVAAVLTAAAATVTTKCLHCHHLTVPQQSLLLPALAWETPLPERLLRAPGAQSLPTTGPF